MTTMEQVHRLAVSDEIAVVAQSMREALGQKLTAFAVGIKDPKAIGKIGSTRSSRRAG